MPHNPYLRDLARLLALKSFPMPSSSGNWEILNHLSGNWEQLFHWLTPVSFFL